MTQLNPNHPGINLRSTELLRPTTPPPAETPPARRATPSPEGPKNPNRKKTGRNALILGGLGAVGLTLAAVLLLPPKGDGGTTSAPQDPQDPGQPGEVLNPPVTTGEYMIELDKLPDMTPEQLNELGTIRVEDVMVDGNIDWDLVAEKTIDITEVSLAAGTTAEEMEELYLSGGDIMTYGQRYDEPILDGQYAEGVRPSKQDEVHTTFLSGAMKSYLLDGKPIVISLTATNIAVQDGANNLGARVVIDSRLTDNLFSSGAYNADSTKDTTELGRSTDLDLQASQMYVFMVQGDVIKINSVNSVE